MAATDFNLSDEQLEAFNQDFRDWPPYRDALLNALEANSIATVMDVGGGNGRFLDQILSTFPNAEGVLIDNAEYMLGQSTPHPRKTQHLGSATNLSALPVRGPFDLVCVNMLLHHLVGASDSETTKNVGRCLSDIRAVLSDGGTIAIFEQAYDGYFNEPGHAVYRLTSNTNPVATRVFRALGANTAGIGVRFRSREAWTELFRAHGLEPFFECEICEDKISRFRRAALGIRWVGSYLFLLRAV